MTFFYLLLWWEYNHLNIKALCKDLSSNTSQKAQSLGLGPHMSTNPMGLHWKSHAVANMFTNLGNEPMVAGGEG